ncbi:MAG: retron St85 family effector protein [Dehalobacterium sp.]
MFLMESEKIKGIIDKLAHMKRTNKFNSKSITKFVFICGEQIINESGTVKSREELEEEKNKRQFLIDKLSSNNVICIISEKIYSDGERLDTLTFEEVLAELSDDILIIVESYGTVCELGAFTTNDKFFKKLIVINDNKYKDKKSFINKGPVRKLLSINEDRYILTEYDYDSFKSCFQIKEYIQKIKDKNVTILPNRNSNKLQLKVLIYELLSIIEMFEPIMKFEINYIYKKVKGFDEYNIENREKHGLNTPTLILKLMENMDLITVDGEYICKKGDFTYYDALFNISKENFSNIRVQVAYEIMKSFPERFSEDENENITVNE